MSPLSPSLMSPCASPGSSISHSLLPIINKTSRSKEPSFINSPPHSSHMSQRMCTSTRHPGAEPPLHTKGDLATSSYQHKCCLSGPACCSWSTNITRCGHSSCLVTLQSPIIILLWLRHRAGSPQLLAEMRCKATALKGDVRVRGKHCQQLNPHPAPATGEPCRVRSLTRCIILPCK